MTPELSRTKKILYALVCLVILYVPVELTASLLYRSGLLEPTPTLGLTDSGEQPKFDPILGYRLPPTPMRSARIDFGKVEYVAVFKGNAQGFQDRHDFLIDRRNPQAVRLAVFGDSFTTAQFLERNWPDAIEAGTARDQRPLEFMNLALFGGGMANWWSTLTRFFDPGGYRVDGVIFAALEGPHDNPQMRTSSLDRGFTTWGYNGGGIHRESSWNPENWPRTSGEVGTPARDSVLSPGEFDRVISGQKSPEPARAWKFYVAGLAMTRLQSAIRAVGGRLQIPAAGRARAPSSGLEASAKANRARLMVEMAEVLHRKSVPALVVRVPTKAALLEHTPPSQDLLEFASALGAPFVDGSAAFDGLTDDQIQACWFPHDGHWAQAGSDRFAGYLTLAINRWLATERTEAARPGSRKRP